MSKRVSKDSKDCLKCNKKLVKKDVFVTCCDCQKSAHAACTRLTPEDVKLHVEKGTMWRCRPCTKARDGRKAIKLGAGEGSVEPKARSPRPHIERGMGDNKYDSSPNLDKKDDSQFENFYDKLGEGSKPKMDLQSALDTIAALKAQNESLNKEIETLAYRLDLTEQATRRNILEITGVPDKKGENMLSLVKQIGTVIDFSVSDDMIDTCYRINRQQKPGYHAILLYFVRRYDKDAFLKAFRAHKNLTPKDLGRSGDSKIFIRESLSFSKRHLLMQAKRVAKELNYKGVGVANGEIFMKKSDEGEPIFVKEARDLENILKGAKK